MMQSSGLRALGYGALVSVGMVWVLHMLISGGGAFQGGHDNLPTIDFVRLKKETELETRTRKKPPKPEPPKQPPPPQVKVTPPPPDTPPPTPFAMPKMNLPTTITGGPFLGAYVGGDLSGYSELIPLVRIAPQYPRNAQRDRIEGFVVMEVTINPDGTVRSARPIKAQPRGVFETAAMQSILKWKFKPKVVDGKGVESKGIQQIDFKMGEE
jgi:periplasmic protein TonB